MDNEWSSPGRARIIAGEEQKMYIRGSENPEMYSSNQNWAWSLGLQWIGSDVSLECIVTGHTNVTGE